MLYTSGDVAGETYDTVAKDSLGYFQIVQNGDGAIESIVDDFGIDGGKAPLAITAINYDQEAGTVTLTWRNVGPSTYLANVSTDLMDWETPLANNITSARDENPGDIDYITATFPLPAGLQNEKRLFFRVEL